MAGKGKPGPKGKRGRPRGIRIQGEHGCRTCQHPEVPRINFLCASGGDKSAIASQFGLPYSSVLYHHSRHITARYKKIIGASRVESFEALLTKAAEGDAESLDILQLVIRGHTRGWALGLESNDAKAMSLHAAKILQATELRAKITRELIGTPTVQINQYLTNDAAQLVQVLENHPEAADAVLRWHQQRTNTRVIEHEGSNEHVSAAD
jgi:hypothetical protein